MQTINPGVQKHLGKKVAGFVKAEWGKKVPTRFVQGLRAKISEVRFCKEFLKFMGTKNIGEANPHDGFYGIAMSVTDKDVWDTSN